MMKKILRTCRQEEKGDVIVFFALSLVVLIAFVSLAIDIGMINMKRAAMMDLCQQMRKARLDAKEYIMYADDPARMIYDISNQCARDNGFQGDLKVYYKEETDPTTPTSEWVEKRKYTVRIELKQEYRFAFAAAFFTGPGTQKITVYLDGGELKTSGKAEWEERVPVWHPRNKFTGSYRRNDYGGMEEPYSERGDYPADWASVS